MGFEVGLIGTTVVNAVLIVILASVVVSSVATEFFARRMKTQAAEAEKLGSSVVLLVATMDSVAPAIDIAARLAASDGGVVLPRLACVGEQSMGEAERMSLEQLVARRGLDAEALVRHDRTLADVLVHTCQDEHATAVVVTELADAFSKGHVHSGVQELLVRPPVPLFLVATRQPVGSLRLLGDGSMLDEVRRAGLVKDTAMHSPGFAGLFRYPKTSAPSDGACVLMSPNASRQVPEDTRIVIVSATSTRVQRSQSADWRTLSSNG